MSLYALQKLIRDVNRKPQCRDAYFAAPAKFAAGYELSEGERRAVTMMFEAIDRPDAPDGKTGPGR